MTDAPEPQGSGSSGPPKGDGGAHAPDSTYAGAADQLASAARSGIDRGRGAAASQAEAMAGAAATAAQQLKAENAPLNAPLARYAERLGEAASNVAERLRTRSLDQLLSDVQAAAREHTSLFLAGSFLAGLAASRFLKASAKHQESSAEDAATSRVALADTPDRGISEPPTED